MTSNQTCISSEENFKNHIQDQFFYLFFNINKPKSLENHYKFFNEFLLTLNNFKQYNETYHYYINLYIRLIAFTRDIYYGLGQRDLSYLLLITLDKYCPQHTTQILNSFFYSHSKYLNKRVDLPYSSWCDIKYLSKFILNTTYMNSDRKDYILNHIIERTNSQLNIDSTILFNKYPTIYNNIPLSPKREDAYLDAKYYVSNVSKWIPNQKNNKILFHKFSNHWHAYYEPYNNQHSHKKYRNVIKRLRNIHYTIDSDHISQTPIPYNSNYFSSKTNISPVKFIKYIKKYIYCDINNETIQSIINDIEKQWLNYLSKFNYTNLYCIPILDLSISDNDDFIDNSIAISCFLSHFNLFGKKILVASEIPFIIDLSQSKTLFHSVQQIYFLINKGITTKSFNIDKSISLINSAFINTKPTIENINIVIFINTEANILKDNPFQPSKYKSTQPSIIYWNLSNKFINKEFLETIYYDYKFINSNVIHHFTSKLINLKFKDSKIDDYFHFLFHKRYQYLSYFD